MRISLLVAAALTLLALPASSAKPQQKQNPNVVRILQQIKGRENLPSSEVFKNVQLMGDTSAKELLAIMDVGYSVGLGVSCEHCHDEDRWEADEKRPKNAARDMIRMIREINTRLEKMENLEVEGQAHINCTTCHRGEKRPALDLK
jgi:hypothetical protein